MFQTLQISITKMGQILKDHPELVKEITYKDGHKEKVLNLTASTSKFGSDIISARPRDVKPQTPEEWRYWDCGNIRQWPDKGTPQTQQSQPQFTSSNDDPNVPF